MFNRSLFLKWLILGALVAIYLLSYYFYDSYLNKKAGQDFLFASFLYRRASEDSQKYGEAEKAFKDMLSQYDGRRWQELALFYLGNIYYNQGKTSEAERVYGQYLSSFPAGDWALEVRLSLASLAENRALYALAVERYEKILKEFPEDYLLKEVYLGLGRSYERLNKLSLAKEYYGRLKANYPGSIYAQKAGERIEEIETRIKMGL